MTLFTVIVLMKGELVKARRQTEARKPGIQHHTRNPDFVACEQHGADQPAHTRSLISAFVIHYLKSKE